MVNISSTYGVKKNWQGDPCFPMNLSWYGVNCSYIGNNSPQNTNLSSSDLTGVIAPALSSLKSVLHLDLSNNSLTGPVREFLAQLPALKILNLANNNLTGSVPKALLKKSSLILSMDGNPNLCWSVSYKLTMTKKNQLTVAIVASVVSSISFFSTIAIWWGLKTRRHKAGRTLKSKNRRFSYSEVVSITNNFETVIGRGGFGTVHLGCLEDGTEVAVKTLYRSSTQASEQFWTEANFLTALHILLLLVERLTTIHHRNLAPLIRYCDEGANTALIYEYMVNGNSQECLLALSLSLSTLSELHRSNFGAPSKLQIERISKLRRRFRYSKLHRSSRSNRFRSSIEAPDLNSDPSITRISSNMHISTQFFLSQAARLGTLSVEQLHKIFKLCGSPSEEYWRKSKLPHATIFKPQQPYRRCVADTFKDFPAQALELMETLLSIDPADRGSAASALHSESMRVTLFKNQEHEVLKGQTTRGMLRKLRYTSSENTTSFCRSSQLKFADFSFNFFVGSIPKCLDYLPRSSFQGNCLQDKDPKQRSTARFGLLIALQRCKSKTSIIIPWKKSSSDKDHMTIYIVVYHSNVLIFCRPKAKSPPQDALLKLETEQTFTELSQESSMFVFKLGLVKLQCCLLMNGLVVDANEISVSMSYMLLQEIWVLKLDSS
ncbi:hypothetical protein TEA_008883 [Camellia sinensis var. sinensis]|uniref:Protein kinase domain-containing protein n=1 Tax=Camellia sinensis var. sinensis TaxID=542762 RepID=A0A4S4D6I7_CAMSN|nr:hypothetical protein TEA_008883 [Camellia sinensis var. sinensis]